MITMSQICTLLAGAAMGTAIGQRIIGKPDAAFYALCASVVAVTVKVILNQP